VLLQFLADAVLVLHFLVVLFVVGGLLMVVAGNWLGWRWVNAWWFRLTHLATIGFIVIQAWLGQLCPLTILESWLRVQAGTYAYEGSFIEHWLHRLLFFQAEPWQFSLAYTVFATLVVLVWWRFPPRRHPGNESEP